MANKELKKRLQKALKEMDWTMISPSYYGDITDDNDCIIFNGYDKMGQCVTFSYFVNSNLLWYQNINGIMIHKKREIKNFLR